MIFILLALPLLTSRGITITAKRLESLPYDFQRIEVGDEITVSELEEILEKEAGIKIKRYGSPGALSQVVSRGISPSHTLVLLNGNRISDPKTGGFDINSIYSGSIESIEIIKGPSSVFLGSNAVNGIVNIVTDKRKRFIRTDVNSMPGASTGLGFCLNDLSFSFMVEDSRGERTNSDFRRFNSSLSWQGLNFYWTHRRNGNPGPVPNPEAIPSFGDSTATSTFDSQVTDFVDVSWKKKILLDEVGIVISPDIHREQMKPESKYLDWFTGDTVVENDEYTTIVGQIDAGIIWKDFTLDIHLEQDTVMMDQYMDTGDTNSWGAGERNAALSLSSVKELGDYTIFASIREDYYRSFGYNPSFSLGFKYPGEISFYFSGGSAFRAPTLNDLYWPDYSNDSLSPEYSMGVNAGVEWKNLSISGYLQDIDDRIGYGDDWRPHNIYKSRIYGLNLGYNGSLGNFSYSLNYSYLDGYDDLDTLQRDLQYHPKHSLTGVLRYSGPVNVELSGSYKGERKKWFDYPGEWKIYDSYFLFDVGVSKRIGNFTGGIEVENVMDGEWVAHPGNSVDDNDYPGMGRRFRVWVGLGE